MEARTGSYSGETETSDLGQILTSIVGAEVQPGPHQLESGLQR